MKINTLIAIAIICVSGTTHMQASQTAKQVAESAKSLSFKFINHTNLPDRAFEYRISYPNGRSEIFSGFPTNSRLRNPYPSGAEIDVSLKGGFELTFELDLDAREEVLEGKRFKIMKVGEIIDCDKALDKFLCETEQSHQPK